jgi:hypothetical protein
MTVAMPIPNNSATTPIVMSWIFDCEASSVVSAVTLSIAAFWCAVSALIAAT